ncbi:MAG: hypothetical protein AAB484_00120 [Patescibacteria group bacterium]
MDISAILPFTEESSDPLFIEQVEKLRQSGNPLSVEELFQIYLEARADIVHAIGICSAFWLVFHDSDIIDVANPATSFYNVVFTRVGQLGGFSIKFMSDETAMRSYRLLAMDGHEHVAQATNMFLNAMIADLKRPDPVLAYALV